MTDMQNENQNNDSQEVSRVKSLPELLSENNNLRKRLAEIEIQGVFASKTVLRAARDNIVANNKDFKIYLENIYKQRQANDNSFTYDKKNITTAAFDTISSHIEDALKEASNSSIFERSDKLKIMEYIKLAIKNSDATDEEKRKLIEHYDYAVKTIKESTGFFDKATVMMTNTMSNIGAIMLSSMNSDLPPIYGWAITRLFDKATGFLKNRKMRKERLSSLEDDIRMEKNAQSERSTGIRAPSLEDTINEKYSQNNSAENPTIQPTEEKGDSNESTAEKDDSTTESQKNKLERVRNESTAENPTIQPTEEKDDSVVESQKNKIERLRNETGSLLENEPTGSESDPFYVVLLNDKSLFKKDKKEDKGILDAIGAFSGVLISFLGKFSGIITTLLGAIGVRKAASTADELAETASDALDETSVPEKENTKSKKKKGASGKKAKAASASKLPKKAVAKAATSVVKKAGASAAIKLLGAAGPVGAAISAIYTAFEGLQFLNDNMNDALTEAKDKYGTDIDDILDAGDSYDDAVELSNSAMERQHEKEKAKMQKLEEENPSIAEARQQPRPSIDDQTDAAKKTLDDNKTAQKTSEMKYAQTVAQTTQNLTTVNQNTTMNRVIQMTNSDAGNVSGSNIR